MRYLLLILALLHMTAFARLLDGSQMRPNRMAIVGGGEKMRENKMQIIRDSEKSSLESQLKAVAEKWAPAGSKNCITESKIVTAFRIEGATNFVVEVNGFKDGKSTMDLAHVFTAGLTEQQLREAFYASSCDKKWIENAAKRDQQEREEMAAKKAAASH